jgi:hypothetical protein
MAYTIRQFVQSAFEEIGYADYVFDLTPAQLQSAAVRLNSMLAGWNAKGVRLGATLWDNPADVDLDADSNIPDMANEAVIASLAVRIAPSYGKTVSPDTKAAAKDAYNTLLARAAMPPEMQLPGTMPAGAGNKPWRYEGPFLYPPADPVTTGPDSVLEI